ncbi:MAG: YdbH domain-containing protein [Desulfuromonadaceae bacterium]|nr:YdbH domain-containing protein [Desulfuromonadaceae bacterium]
MFRRFAALLFLLLAAATLLTFWFRVELADWLISRLLERQGCRQVDVVLEKLDSRHLFFDQLVFSLSYQGQVLDCRLRDVAVDFSWPQILDGMDTRIEIGSVTLHQRPLAALPQKSQPPLDVLARPDRLVESWSPQLPLASLRIHRLTVSGADIPPLLQQPLVVTLEREADIRLTVQTDRAAPVPFELRLRQEASDCVVHLNLDLDRDKGAICDSHIRLDLTPQKLSAVFALPLEKLSSLARGFQHGEWFPQQVGGRLTGQFDWDFKPSLFCADLLVEKLALVPLQVDRTRLQLRLCGPSGGAGSPVYRIKPDSRLSVEGLVAADFSLQKAELGLVGTVLQDSGGIVLRLTPQMPWCGEGIRQADLELRQFSCWPNLSLSLQNGHGAIELQPSFSCTAQDLIASSVRLARLTAQPARTTGLTFDWTEPPGWALDRSRWVVEGASAQFADLMVVSAPLVLELERLGATTEGFQWVSSLSAAWIDVQRQSGQREQVRLCNIKGALHLAGGKWTAEADFLPGRLAQSVQLQLSYDAARDKGCGELWLPEPFQFDERTPFSALLKTWSYPFDLVAGRLALSLDLSWQEREPPEVVAEFRLEQGRGWFKQMVFSGLCAAHRIRLTPRIESLDSLQLSLDSLNPGVLLSGLQARMQLIEVENLKPQGFDFSVQQAGFDLLGGHFVVDPFIWHLPSVSQRMLVRFEQLDLAQVAGLFEKSSLQASGRVDGSLPLEVTAEGVRVEKGVLRQHGPGALVYQTEHEAGALLPGGSGMDLALKVLEDFHYQSLTSDLSFQPDGRLDLALHLQGNNPQVSPVQPIHLNLNVEENLLSLLKSLRYSQAIGQEMIQKATDARKPSQVGER